MRLDPAFVGVDDGGGWNVGLNPNGFMSNDEAVGTWEVTGTCFDAETWQVVVDYETATFEVVAPSAPPATDPRRPTQRPWTHRHHRRRRPPPRQRWHHGRPSRLPR